MLRKRPTILYFALLPYAISLLSLFLPAARAQTGPTITQQPASQTNLAGTTVTLSVGVSGTGPFSYQWQLNGTNLPNNVITTVAGNGIGDGGAATNASLRPEPSFEPFGVAVDASGTLFIADTANNRIRKVDAKGIITTVAGSGSIGYSGDGGAASIASLHSPSGVAVDAIGDLFIADTFNNCIRRVGTNGIITTLAGTGAEGSSGNGGAATNASLNGPHSVTLDTSGNLFIADLYNNCVRKVALAGLPSLTIHNVSESSAGDYQVTITSPYGSVTSVVARLSVLAPPVIAIGVPTVSGNRLLLGFSLFHVMNASFTLLQAPSVTGTWTTNTAAILTTNAQTGGYQFALPLPASVKFFQVRSP